MIKPTVFMFSGQGSQYYQMGQELYRSHTKFKLWMDHCNDIALPLLGTSLLEVLYKGDKKSEPFDDILYTNPALLSIQYSLARTLIGSGFKADYVLGYSLGEISAAMISGTISLEDGIAFVIEWARALGKHSSPAAMLAVLANPDIFRERPELFSQCYVTGNNFESNFVVSGLLEPIVALQSALRLQGIASVRLPVNYGFHTVLMHPLEQMFRAAAAKISFHPCKIPVVSCCTRAEVRFIDDNHLWSVTRNPVHFEGTIQSLLAKNNYYFVDVGPSGSLATFVKYILPEGSASECFEVMNQFGQDVKLLDQLMSVYHTEYEHNA